MRPIVLTQIPNMEGLEAAPRHMRPSTGLRVSNTQFWYIYPPSLWAFQPPLRRPSVVPPLPHDLFTGSYPLVSVWNRCFDVFVFIISLQRRAYGMSPPQKYISDENTHTSHTSFSVIS